MQGTPGRTPGPDLGAVPVFRHLDAEERAELWDLLEPAFFDAGRVIFSEGGPEDRLYVVTAGTAEVHKKVGRGRRQHLATVGAPTVIGEMGLLTEPRAAPTVSAVPPVPAHGVA